MIVYKNKIRFVKSDFPFLKKVGLLKAAELAHEYKSTHSTPFIPDLIQLANFFSYDSNSFFKLLKNINNEYSNLMIKKNNGENRNILIPSSNLKRIQKIVLKKILNKYPVSKYAKAYIKKRTLYDNAIPHVNQKYLLKIDITNFFGSITYEQILSCVFNKNYFPTPVGLTLTALCCYRGALVQGAPTSPILSNLVMKHFDNVMGEWCKKKHINYSRYCDDITFSSNNPLYNVYFKAKTLLEKMGFELNKRKTHFLTNNSRQIVTGLIVNEKVSVPQEYKRQLRQQIYYFLKFSEDDTSYKSSGKTYDSYINSLLGKTAYVLSIEPNNEFFKNKKTVLLNKASERMKPNENDTSY